MKIRRAELSDFEVYKTLFVEDEADMLYRPQKSDIKPQKEDAKDWFCFDEETLKRIHDELERTEMKFKRDLENFREHRIYLLENTKQVMGFFELFNCGSYRWKLAYCGFTKNYQNQGAFNEAVQLLASQNGIKAIDVCVVYKSCERRMERAGFTSIGGGFYRIEAKK